MLRRNLIANFLGQGWTALMGLAFIPLYIRYIGIEAYALIGIFALLQAWLTLLDMGMTPTLNREMARFTGGAKSIQSIRDLLRSIEIIGIGLACIVAIGIWGASEWLASDWLKADKLPIDTVAQSFTLMGVVTALRFIEGIYRSCIIGLQRQVLFNIVNSSMATTRGLGGVAILAWISPTIEAFFIWQGVTSILTVCVLGATTYSTLPKTGNGGSFSLAALQSVSRFAGGMIGITFLALLLTQVDKLLLSKLLPLSDYGYYTLAAVVAGGLYMLTKPIVQAWYPRLCELCASEDKASLAATYHLGAQLITVTMGSAAVIMIVFAETILRLWTQDADLAHHTATLISLLALGNMLHGLMWIPYHTQLAHGWTALAMRANTISVLVIVPAILWATTRYGAEGAAWVWVSLNTSYVLISAHFMFRKILIGEKTRWYTKDILLPLLSSSSAALLVRWLAPSEMHAIGQIITLTLASCLALGSSIAMAPTVRQQLQSYLVRQLLAKSQRAI